MSKNTRNKFMVGAVTAAMVATAVAPVAGAEEVKPNADVSYSDVSPDSSHFPFIYKALEYKIMTGYADNTFKPNAMMTRAQVVKALGKYVVTSSGKQLSDFDLTNVQPFADVPSSVKDQELYTFSLIVKQAGIFKGDNNNLKGSQLITREQMSQVLVNAFGLKDLAGVDSKVTDNASANSQYRGFINILSENGVTSESLFRPKENTSRAQFATFLVRAYEKANGVPTPTEAPVLKYTGTSPINVAYGAAFTAPVVTATDDKDKNVVVTNVIRNASGATVSAIDTKVPGTYTITYSAVDSDGNKAKDLVVTVVVAQSTEVGDITNVDVKAGTFDDDTAGQMVTFTVNNGQTVNTEELRQKGYNVRFVAVSANGANAFIFKNEATGLLNDELPLGDYVVEVQITKDGILVVSDKETIKVTDLESTTTAINSVTYTTDKGVKLNSTNLVTGESANISSIIGNAAGKTNVVLPVGTAEVTSSNPSVLSVSGQKLTANSAGTATITVKVGNATYTTTFKVSNEAREVAKVTSSQATVKLVDNTTRTVMFTALDQYGDPIAVGVNDVVEDYPQNAAGEEIVSNGDLTTNAQGVTTFTFAASNAGSGVIRFEDQDNKVLGSVNVEVTNVDNITKTQVEKAAISLGEDDTFAVGSAVTYQVAQFNSEGAYNGVASFGGTLVLSSADRSVAEAVVSRDGKSFTVTGKKAGTTTISVLNQSGQVIHSFPVTITASSTVVTNVDFTNAATAINYAGEVININDVLDVRPDGTRDPIVYGIEHNANTIAKVRVAASTDGTQQSFYIDANNSGFYNAGEITLGALTAEVLSGATDMPSGNLAISSGAGNYTTAAGDKGSILFRFLVESNGVAGYQTSEAVASTTINVNVPVSPVTPPVTTTP